MSLYLCQEGFFDIPCFIASLCPNSPYGKIPSLKGDFTNLEGWPSGLRRLS